MKWLPVVLAFLLGAAFAYFATEMSQRNGSVRTDLQIYRDAGTGCEYIGPAWGFGALTPRNDSIGVQICGDEKANEAVEKLLDRMGQDPEGEPPTPVPVPGQP